MAAKTLDPQMIKNMNEAEWNAFRLQSWSKKQLFYNQPTPAWYLKDRESFAQYIEKAAARRARMRPKESLTRKVENLAGDDIDAFADDK